MRFFIHYVKDPDKIKLVRSVIKHGPLPSEILVALVISKDGAVYSHHLAAPDHNMIRRMFPLPASLCMKLLSLEDVRALKEEAKSWYIRQSKPLKGFIIAESPECSEDESLWTRLGISANLIPVAAYQPAKEWNA